MYLVVWSGGNELPTYWATKSSRDARDMYDDWRDVNSLFDEGVVQLLHIVTAVPDGNYEITDLTPSGDYER